MDRVKVVVIGAGVVGLAIAYELSKKFSDIVVLEKEKSFGQHISSRNSEVIHAGIYYPKNSLKAKLCVEGNKLLYAFCDENSIPCKKLGKLIVAMDENEELQLAGLLEKSKENGVNDLVWLSASDVKNMEPQISAYKALFSPSTGIIDSHSLMKVLEHKTIGQGGIIAYQSEVTSISQEDDGYKIQINGCDEIVAEILVNSAGLFSDKIAQMAGIDIDGAGYRLHLCKGEYFAYSKPSFLKHLVYPVPEQDIKGLGIHAVLDLASSLKFGPDANYVDTIDYKVAPAHRTRFFNAIKNMYPQIKEEELASDQAGIRPKLQGPNDNFRDFVISEETERGLPGFINLIGIESPGLTSCLAIAEYVKQLLA